jgi:tetratricopeptide (TPR) repeat protein
VLVPVLLYGHTTRFGFLLDDYVLFQTSPSLKTLASIPAGFTTDVGALRKGSATVLGSYYRPVFLALSTLYYQVVGGSPFAWHLASVILAGSIGGLAYALFRRLGFAPLPSLLASAVFSLHPAHVSSVAWAAGLQELLAALFVLLALHALLHRPGAAGDVRAIAMAAVAFALALLSKEVALGMVPLCGVWALARRTADRGESRRFGQATLVFASLTVLYFGARVAVFGALAKPWPGAPDFAASVPSIPVAFVTYLRLLVWPTDFSFFRPERPIWAPLDGTVLVSLLIIVALAALASVAIARHGARLLPAAWLVVWLVPALNLWVLDPRLMVTDRYLFLPSLALPWLLLRLVPPRAATVILALLAIAFGGLSLRYAAIFSDERTFVAAMERAEPTNALVFAEKARLLLRDGKPVEAEAAQARAVELTPHDPDLLRALGDMQFGRGDLAGAEARYRRVLISEPWASRPFKLLVIALARGGQSERAFTLARESAGRWPEDFEVQLMYAVLLGIRGERAEAGRAFETARRLRPWEPVVAAGLDGALSRLAPSLSPASR